MKKYLDIKAQFPKSSSSSSLASKILASSMPTTSSTSTTSLNNQKSHARSASSHTAYSDDVDAHSNKRPPSRPQLVGVESDSALNKVARKDNVKHDMGPPQFIPVSS